MKSKAGHFADKVIASFLSLVLACTMTPSPAHAAPASEPQHPQAAAVENEAPTAGPIDISDVYTLRFSSGSDDASGHMDDMSITAGDEEVTRLPECGFTRPGKHFSGWRVDAPGGTTLQDKVLVAGQNVTGLDYSTDNSMPGSLIPYSMDNVIVLTATWEDDGMFSLLSGSHVDDAQQTEPHSGHPMLLDWMASQLSEEAAGLDRDDLDVFDQDGNQISDPGEIEEAIAAGTTPARVDIPLVQEPTLPDETAYRAVVKDLPDDEQFAGVLLSQGDGAFLLGYPSFDEREAEISRLGEKGALAEPDGDFGIADVGVSDLDGADISASFAPPTETAIDDSSAFDGLGEIVDSAPADIALVDTGASEGPNIVGRLSVIGDDVSDNNGHGDAMAAAITSEFPNAKILSVKALGDNGRGTSASVYAAILKSISAGVKVINLSLTSYTPSDMELLREGILEADRAGVMVVGAAGNWGIPAAATMPGGVSEAVIAGSCDEHGIRLPSSNYGRLVDAYVVSASTSEACARMSGWAASETSHASIEQDLLRALSIGRFFSDDKDEGERFAPMAFWETYSDGSIGSGVEASAAPIEILDFASNSPVYTDGRTTTAWKDGYCYIEVMTNLDGNGADLGAARVDFTADTDNRADWNVSSGSSRKVTVKLHKDYSNYRMTTKTVSSTKERYTYMNDGDGKPFVCGVYRYITFKMQVKMPKGVHATGSRNDTSGYMNSPYYQPNDADDDRTAFNSRRNVPRSPYPDTSFASATSVVHDKTDGADYTPLGVESTETEWRDLFITANVASLGLLSNYGVRQRGVTMCIATDFNKYKVTYNANGGEGGPDVQNVKYNGDSWNIPKSKPKRTGYTFMGWATSKSHAEKGTVYCDAGEDMGYYDKIGNMTLYAIWTPDGCGVHYKYQPKDVWKTFSYQSTTYDSNFNIINDIPSVPGFTFKGWNEDATKKVKYAPGDKVKCSWTGQKILYAVLVDDGAASLVFHANGGAGAPDSLTNLKQQEWYEIPSAPIPSKTGSTFQHYTTAADGTGTVYSTGQKIKCTWTGAKTLYAQYSSGEMSLMFDANGGVGAPSPIVVASNTSFTIPSVAPSWEAHTFLGWSTSQSATSPSYTPGASGMYVWSQTITMYAVWQAETAVIAYDANGGSLGSVPSRMNVTCNQNFSVTSYSPTSYGNQFEGWSLERDGAVVYRPGEQHICDWGGIRTVYAKWTAAPSVLYFNSNGGSGGPSSLTASFGSSFTISPSGPLKPGCEFKGWAASPSAISPTYMPGSSYRCTWQGTMSVYAVYSAASFTVSYDANTPDRTRVEGVPESQSATFGSSFNIASGKPSAAGYSFQGWAASATATSASYAPGASVSYSWTSDLTLYAIWKEAGYTLRYDAGGGTGAPAPQSVTYNRPFTVSGNIPTLDGNSFQGWALEADSEKVDFLKGTSYSAWEWSSDMTVHAVWLPATRFITYNANGGTGEPGRQSCYYSRGFEVSGISPSWSGYTFAGWSTDKNADVPDFTIGGGPYTYGWKDDVTFYAVWIEKAMTLSFDANGGSNAPGASQVRYNGTFTLPEEVPGKSGYEFTGWSFSPQATTPEYTAKGTGQYVWDENRTLYAVWRARPYTIAYASEEGSRDIPPMQTAVFDSNFTVTGGIPIRPGYTFSGWALDPESSSVDYMPGDTYKYSTPGNTTLHAVWNAGSFSLSFDANGGEGSVSPIDCTYLEDFESPDGSPLSRDGYLFAGWASNPSASEPEFEAGREYQFGWTDNARVYAVWAPAPYNITFDANGGEGGPGTVPTVYNSRFNVPDELPVLAGYTVAGYAIAPEAADADYAIKGSYTYEWTRDMTVYAVWKPTAYSISYDANGGAAAPSPTTAAYLSTFTVSNDKPNRIGYTFEGWGEDKDASTSSFDSNSQHKYSWTSNKTFYAVWKANEYTINYYNGDTLVGESKHVYGQTKNLSSAGSLGMEPIDGYDFAGWTGTNDSTDATFGNGQGVTSLSSGANSVVDLYAVYSKTVYFESGTGTVDTRTQFYNPISASNVNLDSPAPSPASIASNGWVPLGWRADSAPQKPTYELGFSNRGAWNAETYYAIYSRTLTLSYEPEGGSGSMEPSTAIQYGASPATASDPIMSVSPNTYSPAPGKAATGRWSVDEKSIQAGIDAKASDVGFRASLPGGTPDLSAKALWTGSYAVSYDPTGGQGAPATQQKIEGQPLMLASSTPTRNSSEGFVTVTFDGNGGTPSVHSTSTPAVRSYSFSSWNTTSGGSGTSYMPGSIYSHDEKATLFAQWNESVSASSISLPQAERPGFTFMGWAESPSSSFGETADFKPADNMTLYAIWSANNATSGNAYAVLSSDGELVLFRSNERYEGGFTENAVDIYGNKYTGMVFCGLEEDNSQSPDKLWHGSRLSVNKVRVAAQQIIQPVNCSYWFEGCSNLVSASMNGLNTSYTRSMSSMFEGCGSMTLCDVSSLATGNVTLMESMFKGCSCLNSLDVSSFSTSSVATTASMFEGCSSLAALDVSGFDVSGVEDMSGMFKGCSGLSALPVSGFDTGSATDMSSMFEGCSSLSALDLSSADVSSTASLSEMFSGCTSLSKVTLGPGYDFAPAGASSAVLPNAPDGSGFSGEWIYTCRSGNASQELGARFSAAALRDSYASSTMCGTYEWARFSTLSYDANGGTGNMGSQRIFQTGTLAAKSTYKKSRHSFIGWNTKPDGTGTRYIPGDTVMGGDAVLYAQWSMDPHGQLEVVKEGSPITKVNKDDKFSISVTMENDRYPLDGVSVMVSDSDFLFNGPSQPGDEDAPLLSAFSSGIEEMVLAANSPSNNIKDIEPIPHPDKTHLIALIDTGVENGSQVVLAESVIEDDGIDVNGHGTTMLREITGQDPNAMVISIKALGDDGMGKASDVYKAIELAVKYGADIINLSFAAPDTLENAIIAAAVSDAADNGATVIAAAGNGGYDASMFTPANISDVYAFGALDEDGNVKWDSNRGTFVDAYIMASSTSAAAAKASGWISAHPDVIWQDSMVDEGFAFVNPPNSTSFINVNDESLVDQIGNSVKASAATVYTMTIQYNANGGTIKNPPSSWTHPTSGKTWWYKLVNNIVYESTSKNGTYEICTSKVKTTDTAKDIISIIGRCSLVRDGYHGVSAAKYYNTKANGTGTFINDDSTDTKTLNGGTQITKDKSITLYKYWEPNNYTVTYDANGGSNAPSSTSLTYDKNGTLSTTKPVRANYTFNGWQINGSGTTYAAGATVKNLTTTNNGTVAMKASWTENPKYTVTYNGNGGTPARTSDSVYQGSAASLPSATKTNATFAGWYTATSGGTYLGTTYGSYTPTSNVTIYAHWNYTVSYSTNGYSYNSTPTSSTVAAGGTVTLPNPGWPTNDMKGIGVYRTAYLNANGGSCSQTSVSAEQRHNYNSPRWYTASSGGTLRGNASATYTPTQSETLYLQLGDSLDWIAATLPTPTRAHYTFDGWYTASSGGSLVGAGGASYTPSSNGITIYAHWTRIVNTITFYNGSNVIGTQNVNDGDGAYLTSIGSSSMSKTSCPSSSYGWSFYGWGTSSTTQSRSYSDGGYITPSSNTSLYAIYSRNVSLKYYNNSDALTTTQVSQYYYGNAAKTLTLVGLSNSSYNWVPQGWSLSSSGTSLATSSTTATTYSMPATSTGLYAVYRRAVYLAHDGNGYTGGSASTSSNYQYFNAGSDAAASCTVTTGTSNMFSRTGYTFSKWNGSANGSGTAYNASSATFTVPQANTYWNTSTDVGTIYAQWTANSYSFSYNANYSGASPSTISDSVTYDSTWTTKGPYSFSRTGLRVGSWNTAANGSGTRYEVSAQQPAWTTASGPGTLYAQWIPDTYTVTYNSNYGTPTTTTQETEYTKAWDVKAGNTFSRTGYSLSSWNDAADGKGTSYQLEQHNDSWNRTSDLTLYAVWTANKYPVTYHVNYDGKTDSTIQNVTFDSKWTPLGGDALSRPGYSISKWNTSSDGTGADYQLGTERPAWATTNGLDLYAMWTANKYTLTYSSNDGSGKTSQQEVQYDASWQSKGGSTFSREGYTLIGWSRSSGANNAKDYELATLQGDWKGTSNTTLYAVWRAHTYDISYYDGSILLGSSSHVYDISKNLNSSTSLSAAKNGWSFYGWSRTSGSPERLAEDGASVTNLTSDDNGSVALYAIWSRTLTFYGGLDRSSSTSREQYFNAGTFTSVTTPAITPITSWTPIGWYNSAAVSTVSTYAESTSVKPTDAVTEYYAIYNRTTTLAYDGNQSTAGSVDSQTAAQYYNSSGNISTPSFPLSSNGFARTGYTFSGKWAANSPSGDEWEPGDAYTGWAPAANSTVTTGKVYAIWNANPYTVTYKSNYEVDAALGQTIHYDSKWTTKNATVFGRVGYSVVKWTEHADGSGAAWEVDKEQPAWALTSGMTVYAQWEANPYTVTYDYAGGTKGQLNPSSTVYDDPAFAVSTPTRYGYTFEGWKITNLDACEHQIGTSTTNATELEGVHDTSFRNLRATTGEVLFTATWQGLPATVKYDPNGGTGTVPDQTVVFGSQWLSQPATAFTRDGYELVGWSTSRDGSGSIYHVNTASAPMNTLDDVTVFAIWEPVLYKVEYLSNDGMASKVSQSIRYGGTWKAKGTGTFSRNGYSLASWNSAADGSGTSYAPGSDMPAWSLTTPLSLFAQWEAKPHSMSFDGNGGTGTMPALSAPQEQEIPVPECQFENQGQFFTGWNTSADGSGYDYFPNANIALSSNITLYAQWSPNYTRTFEVSLKAGQKASFEYVPNGTSYSVSDGPQPANWTRRSQSPQTGSVTANETAEVTSLSLYASYKLSFDSNRPVESTASPLGDMEPVGYAHGETAVVPDSSFSLEGYSFVGWNTTSTGSGTSYSVGDALVVDGNVTLFAQWDWNPILSFDANGGTGDVEPTAHARNTVVQLPECSFTRDGYTFVKWSEQSNGSGSSFRPGDSITLSDNIVLYAQWAWNPTISFDANRGSGTISPATIAPQSEYTVPGCEPMTRDGYTFSSWNTSADGTGTDYAPSSKLTTSRDITLYAQWSWNPVASFDANGGTGTMPSIAHVDGEEFELPESGFTREGYTFAGWSTTSDGTSGSLPGGAKASADEDITYYAQWSWNPVLSYDGNGGEGSIPSSSTVKNGLIEAAGNTFTRDGYTFIGWNTEASGGGTDVAPGELIAMAMDTVLYAQWSWNPIVSYDANEGTGSMPSATVASNADYEIAPCSFTREGYRFIGWNTSSDGSGAAAYPHDKVNISHDVTYYAQWERIPVIRFDANGGEGSIADVKVTVDSSYILPAGGFSREGHSFIGWRDEPNGTSPLIPSGATFTVNDDVTFYAQWQWNPVLAFDSNGGTGEMPPVSKVKGDIVNVPDNPFTRDGYTFTGFNTQANGEGETYQPGDEFEIDGDTTLFAQWSKDLTVSYDGNSGSGEMPASILSEGASYTLLENGFENTGYEFTGWNTRPNGTGDAKQPGDPWEITASVVFYAQWQWQPVVTLDPNGGTGELDKLVFSMGEEKNLPTSPFSRDGYVFAGWNTEPDGTGTPYEDEALFKAGEDTVLYAQWDWKPFLSYDANGGSGAMSSRQYVRGTEVTASDSAFERDGYTFVGYNTQANGKGEPIAPGDKFTLSEDTILFAQWTWNPNVSYDANSGSGNMPSTTLSEGDEYELLPNGFDHEGYSFIGWSTAADGNTGLLKPGDTVTVTHDVTFYAQWQWNPIVQFIGNGGEGEMDSVVLFKGTDYVLPGNTGFERNHYMFTGWSTEPDDEPEEEPAEPREHPVYAEGSTFTVESDTTFYAQWLFCPTVSFDGNGGEGEMPSTSQPSGTSYTVPYPDFVNGGYSFTGWNTLPSGLGTSYEPGKSIVLSEDLLLYATWGYDPTLSFDGNQGIGQMASIELSSGEPVTIPDSAFSRFGYSFTDWNTEASGLGRDIVPGTELVLSDDTVLYAQWDSNPRRIYAVVAPSGDMVFCISRGDYPTDGNVHTVNDIEGNVWSGRVYSGFDDVIYGAASQVPWDGERDIVKTITFAQSIAPKGTAYWFSDMESLELVDASLLDLSAAKSTSNMFAGDTGLENIDVSTFDMNGIEDMSGMFARCSALSTLDVSTFKTVSASNMEGMFAGCSNVKHLDLSSFSTRPDTKTNGMFDGCLSMSSITLGGNYSFNGALLPASPAPQYSGKWINNGQRHAVPVSPEELASSFPDNDNMSYSPGTYVWDSAAKAYAVVTDAGELVFFRSLNGYQDGPDQDVTDIEGLRYHGHVYGGIEDTGEMAPWHDEHATSITSTYVSGTQVIRPFTCENWYLDCYKLELAELSGINTARTESFASMFENCRKLPETNLLHFSTIAATKFQSMFKNCYSIPYLDLSWIEMRNDRPCNIEGMLEHCNSLKKVTIGELFDTSMGNWLTDTAGSYIDTDGIWWTKDEVDYRFDAIPSWKAGTYYVNMDATDNRFLAHYEHDGSIFIVVQSSSRGLPVYGELVNIVEFNPQANFAEQTSDILGVSPASASRIVIAAGYKSGDLDNYFNGFLNATAIDGLDKVDTSSATTMKSAFEDCGKLSALNLSSFNTLNVSDMSAMFNGCSALESLNLAGFDTSITHDMNNMFDGCSSLRAVTLGPDFSFEGDGSTRAQLPDPPTDATYSGKWINSSVNGSHPVTAAALSDNYPARDGDHQPGTYIWAGATETYYAVVTDDGELVFFKSLWSYTGNTRGLFTDTAGNTFTGTVYTGYDTETYAKASDVPWHDQRDKVTNVRSTCVISPASTAYWLYDMNNLVSADLSLLDTRNTAEMGYMFDGSNKLARVELGERFSFTGDGSTYAELPDPPRNDEYRGTWVKGDPLSLDTFSPESLSHVYDGASMAGTYIWAEVLPTFIVDYYSNFEVFGLQAQTVTFNLSWSTYPENTFERAGWTFVGWNTEPDATGDWYAADEIQPAWAEEHGIQLYAQWKFTAEVTGIEEPLNPDKDENGLGDNLSFTVPTQLNFVAMSNGELVGPSRATAFVENLSSFGIHVTSLETTPFDNWNIVPDAETSDAENALSLRIGPAAEVMANIADFFGKHELSGQIREAWGMTEPDEENRDANKLFLNTDGKINNVSKDIAEDSKFGELQWYVKQD